MDTGLEFYIITDSSTRVWGIARVHPSFIGRVHKHPVTEKYRLLQGRGCLYISGKISYMEEGDTVTIKANEPHAFVALQEEATLEFVLENGPFESIEYIYTGETLKRPSQ